MKKITTAKVLCACGSIVHNVNNLFIVSCPECSARIWLNREEIICDKGSAILLDKCTAEKVE